eukprot:COSAG02_NODE_5196_length_4549_cov_2.138427_1_plen_303_part_00
MGASWQRRTLEVLLAGWEREGCGSGVGRMERAIRLPDSAMEWLRAPGAGSLHELACTYAVTGERETAASPPARQPPKIGLLTSEAQGGSCVDCGQHHMFCSCSGYHRDTRLSADLDPREPRSSLKSRSVRTVRTVRSLLAEHAAADLRTFELAASEQVNRIEQDRKNSVMARGAAVTECQRPRRVSFEDKDHEQPVLEARQIADMMDSARRRARRQSMPAVGFPNQLQAVTQPAMVEIIENYFEHSADKSDEKNAKHTLPNPSGCIAEQERAQTKPRMVNSTSLVFEDAEADELMGRSPPSC